MGSDWLWYFVVMIIVQDIVLSAEFRRMAVDSQHYLSMDVRNKEQCHQLCVSQTLCVFFNYDVRERICQLFTQSFVSGGSLVHRPHSVYVDVPRAVSSRRSGSCSQRKCKKLDVCVSTGHVQHVCLSAVLDCGELGSPPNTLVKYNSTVFGSVALVECLEGYHSNSTSSVCQASGTWSSFSQCLTKSCSSPPSLPNGDVAYSSLLVGSVATYSCNKDHAFFGLNMSSVCDLTGSWNGLSGYCQRIAFYNRSSPLSETITGLPYDGWKVEILGTPTKNTIFGILLKHADVYIAFGLAARFNWRYTTNVVVRSSYFNNHWGKEERDQPYFPFAVGTPFNLTILVKNSTFDVYVDEAYFVNRVREPGLEQIDRIEVFQSLQIELIKFFI